MEKNNEIKHKIAHTFAEDMEKVLEDNKSGLIKKIIHDEEKHEIEKRNLSPESKKNKLFMLIGSLFIVLGFATLFFFFLKKETPTIPVQKQFTPIIFSDQNVLIEVADLKKDGIVKKVINEINGTFIRSGGLEGIYLTLNKSLVGFKKFIEIIEGNFNFGSNNFINDNFLIGVVKNDKEAQGNGFFILLKVSSITDIFSAMREWEKKMFYDLHGFFGVDISTETKDFLTKDFEDGIIGNKNARILYDKDKKIVMMYILANDNSVIITGSESAAYEIMLRLVSSQIKK